MAQLRDPFLILIVILAINFVALGVSRIRAVINAVAFQGVLLGLFPLIVNFEISRRGVVLMLVTIVLKGFVIPESLRRAMRAAEIQHEHEPVISYGHSLLGGAGGIVLAMIFSSTLPLAPQHSRLLLSASLATVLTGFLLLMTRHKLIMQVLGYLLLENGIFMFGLLLLEAIPLLVELGVLLDLLTGVLVMVIVINKVNVEFKSMSSKHLSQLKG
ncbi:MAG: hydrogenase [Planctomycetota bacterium]